MTEENNKELCHLPLLTKSSENSPLWLTTLKLLEGRNMKGLLLELQPIRLKADPHVISGTMSIWSYQGLASLEAQMRLTGRPSGAKYFNNADGLSFW